MINLSAWGRDVRRLTVAGAILMVVTQAVCVAGEAKTAAAPLTPETTYWRGEREVSPGAFLCEKPAATGVTVACDRWPDGSDLRQFGLDAARLSGAMTDHDRAIAVWRWVRRWTMYTDGTPPLEPLSNPQQSRKAGGYIDDPIKQLNVNGAHWCDGLAQIMATTWRAMGHRAEKLYCHGHTLADCFYKDFDGVERWHWFDVSEGGFVLDGAGRRVLSPDELVSDYFSDWCFGWVHCQHLDQPTHRVDLAFRTGERLERIWGNWGLAFQDNVGKSHQTVADPERGPYPIGFGNGRWTYRPDLTEAEWMDGLVVAPENLRSPHPQMRTGGGRPASEDAIFAAAHRGVDSSLQPAAAGKPGTAVWRFRTPYIVSDAEVRMTVNRKSAADTIRLHLSVDDGQTWKPLWDCPADVVGRKDLVLPICDKFKVANKTKPPDGFNSPFGRYHYRLKLELAAKDQPADCQVAAIEFVTTVQQNYYSLPQLQPGKNAITVKGELAKGAALKVTYVWDDPAGKGRRNVTVVEQTPYTYEIVAGGRKWEDCVCKSLTIEAVPATGRGNRTEVKESPAPFSDLPPMVPATETRECLRVRPGRTTLPTVDQLIADLDTPAKTRAAAYGLMELRDPKSFDALKRLAYEVQPPPTWNDPLTTVKEISLVAMFHADREKAKPVLLDILSDATNSKWKADGKGLNGTWPSSSAIIGFLAAEAGWKEFVPPLVHVLDAPQSEEVQRGVLRALGRLRDPRAGEVIRKYLAESDLDTVEVAALAAGQIGDREAIPLLRKHLNVSYPPAACNAARALAMLGDKESEPTIRAWLTRAHDEDFRGTAAEALASIGGKESVPALESALKAEPFPWVREKIGAALTALRK